MRLKIQDVLITGRTDSIPGAQHADPSTAYYLATGSKKRGVRLKWAGGTGSSPTPGPLAATLNRAAGRLHRYRFFYSNKFVALSGEPLRRAILLWADSREQLDEYSARARQNPAFSCEHNAACVTFAGLMTASVEILVQAKGTPKYVDLGSSVRDVMYATDGYTKDPRVLAHALTILREFRGQVVPVHWQNDADILNLPVVDGDALSW